MRLDHWSLWSIIFIWQCNWQLRRSTICFLISNSKHRMFWSGSMSFACSVFLALGWMFSNCWLHILLIGFPFVSLNVLWVFILVIHFGKQNVIQCLLCASYFDRYWYGWNSLDNLPCGISAGVYPDLPGICLNVHLFVLIIC